jgi:PspA associated protein B
MKLLDTLFGRTKPVKANLDALFSLPSAAITLEVSAGYVPTGNAGVCFKPPTGQPFAEVQAEIEQLLRMPDDDPNGAPDVAATPRDGTRVRVNDVADSFGYRWILVEGQGIDDLVTRVHVVHSSLEDAGWSTQILCSVFAFAHDDHAGSGEVVSPVYLVYLAKRGTFYPFAPTGKEQRDNELELSLRATIGTDLPVEEDLTRWFPLWDLPLR